MGRFCGCPARVSLLCGWAVTRISGLLQICHCLILLYPHPTLPIRIYVPWRMPIRGINHSSLVSDDSPYFRSLAELDQWAQTLASLTRLEGVLPYIPRSLVQEASHAASRGKLLVIPRISTMASKLKSPFSPGLPRLQGGRSLVVRGHVCC